MESTVSRERPILFKDWEVRAILDGRKTQTRRPVVPGPSQRWLTQSYIQSVPHGEMYEDKGLWQMHHPKAGTRHMGVDVEYDSPGGCVRSPFGVPGDRLWVREAWATHFMYADVPPSEVYFANDGGDCTWYRADDSCRGSCQPTQREAAWRPSGHMPRWASRLTLEIKRVWVERVQEISERNAEAEGCPCCHCGNPPVVGSACKCAAHTAMFRSDFRKAWGAIYAKRGLGWDANPWVWACEFVRIET